MLGAVGGRRLSAPGRSDECTTPIIRTSRLTARPGPSQCSGSARWGASCRGKGAIPPNWFVRSSLEPSSGLCSAGFRRLREEDHVQAYCAHGLPRGPQEGGEALAQGASRERRRGARAARQGVARRRRHTDAPKHPARARARAGIPGWTALKDHLSRVGSAGRVTEDLVCDSSTTRVRITTSAEGRTMFAPAARRCAFSSAIPRSRMRVSTQE